MDQKSLRLTVVSLRFHKERNQVHVQVQVQAQSQVSTRQHTRTVCPSSADAIHMFTTLLPVELCMLPLWRDTCYLLTIYRRVNSVPI